MAQEEAGPEVPRAKGGHRPWSSTTYSLRTQMERGRGASREAKSGQEAPLPVSSSARRHWSNRGFAQLGQWRQNDPHHLGARGQGALRRQEAWPPVASATVAHLSGAAPTRPAKPGGRWRHRRGTARASSGIALREAESVACQRSLRRVPGALHAHGYRVKCRLTPRSRGDPPRPAVLPAQPFQSIIG